MSPSAGNNANSTGLGVVMVLFAVLLLASQGTELLRQLVIVPGSAAELGLPADCRADELEEEGLSLRECQLMVANVELLLSTSPDWFRPLMLVLSASACLAAVLAMGVGFGLVASRQGMARLALPVLGLLLLLDLAGFIAAVNTGPLLRAYYLWPGLMWLAIHLSLLAAAYSLGSGSGGGSEPE